MSNLGCEVFDTRTRSLAGDLSIYLAVEPDEVNSGESFSVRYSLINSGSERIEFVTGCAAFAKAVVFQGNKQVNFRGSGAGCRTSLGYYSVDAKQRLDFEWTVHTYGLQYVIGESRYDTTFADPGAYVVRIIPNVAEINGEPATLDEIERVVTVAGP